MPKTLLPKSFLQFETQRSLVLGLTTNLIILETFLQTSKNGNGNGNGNRNGNDAFLNVEQRSSLNKPPKPNVTWSEYISAAPGKYPCLGRPIICKTKNKRLKLTVAMVSHCTDIFKESFHIQTIPKKLMEVILKLVFSCYKENNSSATKQPSRTNCIKTTLIHKITTFFLKAQNPFITKWKKIPSHVVFEGGVKMCFLSLEAAYKQKGGKLLWLN